jgi:hypothetical protein
MGLWACGGIQCSDPRFSNMKNGKMTQVLEDKEFLDHGNLSVNGLTIRMNVGASIAVVDVISKSLLLYFKTEV